MRPASSTRWVFAFRIAVRSLRRSRGQALLVLATIAVPVLVATTAATAATSLTLSPVRQLDLTAGPRAAAWVDTQAINTIGSTVLSRAVLTDPPPADQVPFPDPRPPLSGQDAALTGILGAGLVALAALLVAPAFAVSVRRSQRELALLSAIGARRRDLRRIVVLQGATSGVTATTVAVAAGIGLVAVTRTAMHVAGSVAMPDLRVPWSGIAAVSAIAIIAPTVAAWWPARQAANQDPVAARSGRSAVVGGARGRSLAPAGVTLAGVASGVGGVVTSSPVLLAVAAIVLLAGILGLLGGMVGLATRLAPRLGTSWRYALRDADRRRSRTVPAVAGVMAAVAVAVGAASFGAAHDAHQEAVYGAPTGPGTVRVSAPGRDASTDPTPAQWDALDQALAAALPTTSISPITVGLTDDGEGTVWFDVASTTNDPLPALGGDRWHPASWEPDQDPNAPLVDDGTAIAHLGIPGAERAAAALAEGKLVVRWPRQVSADGTARVGIGHGSAPREVTVPAVAVDLGNNGLRMIVPPDLAAELGLRTVQQGLLATTSNLPDADAEARAHSALDAITPGIDVAVERGYTSTGTAWTIALCAAAALVAAAAAGICVALAAADSRPDLATLAAIGSPRRLRRGIATAQAAVILALGALLGTGLGMVFATAVVLGRRHGRAGIDPTWSIHWPWPVVVLLVVVVPAITLAGAWLLTPARLPLTRRLAD